MENILEVATNLDINSPRDASSPTNTLQHLHSSIEDIKEPRKAETLSVADWNLARVIGRLQKGLQAVKKRDSQKRAAPSLTSGTTNSFSLLAFASDGLAKRTPVRRLSQSFTAIGQCMPICDRTIRFSHDWESYSIECASFEAFATYSKTTRELEILCLSGDPEIQLLTHCTLSCMRIYFSVTEHKEASYSVLWVSVWWVKIGRVSQIRQDSPTQTRVSCIHYTYATIVMQTSYLSGPEMHCNTLMERVLPHLCPRIRLYLPVVQVFVPAIRDGLQIKAELKLDQQPNIDCCASHDQNSCCPDLPV